MLVLTEQDKLKAYNDNKAYIISLLASIPTEVIQEASVYLMQDMKEKKANFIDLQKSAVQALIQAISEPLETVDIEFNSEFVGYKTEVDKQGVIHRKTIMKDEFYINNKKGKTDN